VSNGVQIVQQALSDWESSINSNSDELHTQMVGMHKHIWSTLQHRMADLRYDMWRYESEVRSLDSKIRLQLARNNYGEAKSLQADMDKRVELIRQACQDAVLYQLQIDEVEHGAQISYVILAERGKPIEHPFRETQLEIINRHEILLQVEQSIQVNDGTDVSMLMLLQQEEGLLELRRHCGAAAHSEVAMVGASSGLSCWARIPASKALETGIPAWHDGRTGVLTNHMKQHLPATLQRPDGRVSARIEIGSPAEGSNTDRGACGQVK
jgi:hypothetical protein